MKLIISPVNQPDSNKLDTAYELREDFRIVYKGNYLRVPKFFQFDGASIPRFAHSIIGTPFNPLFMEAAVVHDWLYHTHQISKKEADKLFYELLIKNGISKIKAKTMHKAVAWFGSSYWKNDKEDLKYLERLRTKLKENYKVPKFYGF